MSIAFWKPWTAEEILKERTSSLILRLVAMLAHSGAGSEEAMMISDEIDRRAPPPTFIQGAYVYGHNVDEE